jgi:magnesium transporter
MWKSSPRGDNAMATPQALLTLQGHVEILIAESATEELKSLLTGLHPADIADLLDVLTEPERVVVFELLDAFTAAEVLDETLDDTTLDLVEAVPDEHVADLLEILPMDDAAELLSELPASRSEEIIALMEPDDASEVQALLAYTDETAGRLMTEKVIRVRRRWTVEETIQHLREMDPETETFAYLYAVDDNDCMTGVVPLRRLLTASPEAILSDLVDPNVISVNVDTDQEEVARLVARYDFAAIPVLDRQRRLVGVITHDDVVDILAEEATEDIQRLGGSQPLERTYLSVSVVIMARKRIGWLLMLLLTATLTSTVMKLFEGELVKMAALALFVPMLIGTGGNAGSQTSATVIRALGVGEINPRDALRVLWQEVRTGLVMSIVMSAAAFLYALFWSRDQIAPQDLALAVSLAIAVILLWAVAMGALLPLLAAYAGIDPAIVSGPMMSTLVDATGLLIYFNIARLVLNL